MGRAVGTLVSIRHISYLTARFVQKHQFSTDIMSLKGQATI